MIIIELIYNLALLVALSVLSGFIDIRFYRTTLPGKILQGILFGGAGIIGMLYPFVLEEGIIFDGRSIVISLCTLFFGPLPGAIAASAAVVFRLYLGGVGILMGVLVISSSFLIGYIFHKDKLKRKNISNLYLYVFGLLVHITMLIFVLALPSDAVLKAYREIGFTVIGIFPVIAVIIGKILLDQEKRDELLTGLKKSEAKFRALADSSPSAIFIYQKDNFVYANHAIVELTGYKQEELLKMQFWSVVHPEHRERAKARGLKRLSGEEVINRYQFKVLRKQGDVRWVDFSSTLIDYEGKPAALGTAYDITSSVNSIEEVRKQKELFKTTLYSIGDAVITTNTDGEIQNMNPVAEKLTGWNETDAQGKPLKEIFKIINEETREDVNSPVDEVLKKGMIVGLANHTILISKSGKEIPISDSGAPIKNEAGKIIGVVLVFRDQTVERETEKRIKESEEKYRGLFNSFRDAVLVADKRRKIIDCNPAFEDMFGYKLEDLKGKPTEVIYKSKEEFENMGHEITENINNPNFLITVTYKKKNGETFPGETNVFYFESSPGKISGYVGLIRDITQRLKVEQELISAKEKAEKANQLKSDFLAQVSHEIRSPLNAVLNFASIIKEETNHIESEILDTSFKGIESASRRVIRTIDLILNMSELQLGIYHASCRKFDLVESLINLKREYHNLAKMRNLELKFKSLLQKAEIESDDYAINQIFANLIDNAIKYTKEGFVEIELVKNQDDKFCIYVRDSGLGMSADYINHIFDAFSQEEHGYSRRFEGSGLGMSLVKKYIDLINAEIKVESEKGKGTTFTVIIPRN